MLMLKRLVLPVLKVQCAGFRTNCDYLFPTALPQAIEIAILRKLAENHLRALEVAMLCFPTSSAQWGRYENLGGE